MALMKTLSAILFSGVGISLSYYLPWAEKRLFLMKLNANRKSLRHASYHDQVFAKRAVKLLYRNLRSAEKKSLPFSAFVSLAEVYQYEPAHLVVFLTPTATSLTVEVYIRSRRFDNRKYKVRTWTFRPWTE